MNKKKFKEEGEWESRNTCLGIIVDLRRLKEGIQFCAVSMPEDKRNKLRDLLLRP